MSYEDTIKAHRWRAALAFEENNGSCEECGLKFSIQEEYISHQLFHAVWEKLFPRGRVTPMTNEILAP